MEISAPFCETLPYGIVKVVPDLQQTNLLYVLTENGEIYIFDIRS